MIHKWRAVFSFITRAVIAVLFVIALFVYAMFQGGFVSWFLFYSVSLLLAAGAIFATYPLSRLKVARKISNPYLRKGETAEVHIQVRKKSLFPLLYIGVHDHVPPGFHLQSHPAAFFPMLFSQEKTFSYVVKAEKRGIYHFGQMDIESGDLFGFWQKEKPVVVHSKAIVYPRVFPLPPSLSQQQFKQKKKGAGVAGHQNHEETLTFANLRDYTPGDRLSRIDWKITARRGDLVTKEFETESDTGHTILLETRVEEESVFETAVEWAAALVNEGYKHNAVLNLVNVTGDIGTEPSVNDRSRQIMTALARVQRDAMETPSIVNESPVLLQSVIYIIPRLHDAAVVDVKNLKQQGYDVSVLYHEDEASSLQFKQLGIQAIPMSPLSSSSS